MKLSDLILRLAGEKTSPGLRATWNATRTHLNAMPGGATISLTRITPAWLRAFLSHLEAQNLKPGSRATYFSKVVAALSFAFREKLIRENPAENLNAPPRPETQREYLSLTELKQLAAAPCENESLKRAFLFSALTGLRWSDVIALGWENLRQTETGTVLRFSQRKTGFSETLPISDQATALLGNRNTKQPFAGLAYSSWTNSILKKWLRVAAVFRRVTFHAARHTFATLQLNAGTDLYTLSRLLGHRDIKTTQIYAHLSDQRKTEAVNRIQL